MDGVAARVLVVENDPSDPVANLGSWLIDAGLQLEHIRVHSGQPLPESLTDFDGLVVMGGEMAAAADRVAPWLAEVRALLAEAVAQQVPTFGICLGAQLLALATGGTVEPNPAGPELGACLIAKRQASAADPLFRSLPITPDVLQWHVDAVTVLPPDAQLLASSPMCAVQAFRVGRSAWGIQFHIENTPEMVTQWAASTPAADYGLEPSELEALVQRSLTALPDIAEAWIPFAVQLAAVIKDPLGATVAPSVPTVVAEPITDKAAIRAALAAEAQNALAGPLVAGSQLPIVGRYPHQ